MSDPLFSVTIVVAQNRILTSNQRLHPMVKAQRTLSIRNHAQKEIEANYSHVVLPDRVHCHCFLGHTDKRRRDPGNWYPTAKAVIDGFVKAGLLDDDDHLHLVGPDMRIGEIHTARGFVLLHFQFSEVAK